MKAYKKRLLQMNFLWGGKTHEALLQQEEDEAEESQEEDEEDKYSWF